MLDGVAASQERREQPVQTHVRADVSNDAVMYGAGEKRCQFGSMCAGWPQPKSCEINRCESVVRAGVISLGVSNKVEHAGGVSAFG